MPRPSKSLLAELEKVHGVSRLRADGYEEPHSWREITQALLLAVSYAHRLAEIAESDRRAFGEPEDPGSISVELTDLGGRWPCALVAQGERTDSDDGGYRDVVWFRSRESVDAVVAKLTELRERLPTDKELYADG